MGMIKNYLLKLLEQCSEEQFGQEAIEWAIATGCVRLSYDLHRDVHAVMSKYDEIIEGYRLSRGQGTNESRKIVAPMKRGASRARVKAAGSGTSMKRKSAA